MRVDIRPQWKRLANWYWEQSDEAIRGLSIWEALHHGYGAVKAFNINNVRNDQGMWVIFPDEASYTAFLLRWG